MEDEKIKVFVVDASEVWRKILINHVSSAPDMEVVGEINSSQGSILMLDEVNPDVVLLDVNAKDRMPLGEVITQLKSIDPNIHIVLCTDKANMANVADATDSGIQDFILKPYKREMVLRSIYESVREPLTV
jgi:DNA-binding NarL/FixJ family response regulator